jgi:hypothetical protein
LVENFEHAGGGWEKLQALFGLVCARQKESNEIPASKKPSPKVHQLSSTAPLYQ